MSGFLWYLCLKIIAYLSYYLCVDIDIIKNGWSKISNNCSFVKIQMKTFSNEPAKVLDEGILKQQSEELDKI